MIVPEEDEQMEPETAVEDDAAASDTVDDGGDDDLEAQMAAAMAAEGMSGEESAEDDLEAQMAAAMAGQEADAGVGEDDLEAQMAAAMDAGGMGGDMSGGSRSVSGVDFQQLMPTDEDAGKDNIDRLLDVGLNLSVELGRKDMQIRDILALGPGKIIELDKLAGEPVDLLVNGKLLAKGEVVVVDENFGVRITELLDPVDRIKML